MKKKITISLLLLLFMVSHGFGQEYAFNNPNLSIEERVEDLMSRMTLEEKAAQLMFESPAIERLGVRRYSWWNECLHGVARNGKATVFPQAIGLAATFDPELMQRMGNVIALEARAKFNANRKTDYMDRYAGLTFWSPNVNLFRDPRWGRGQETYGEDPYLISQMGVSFVKGLQGDGEIMKVAAMAKHYAVHSGPEKLRHEFNAVVSDYDLWNTYLPGFESLVVEADVEGVMGAYNRTNGEACSAHSFLMEDVLRKRWEFDGYYVSDCWAIQDFFQGHGITKTREEAAALALAKGCNLNCGNTYPSILDAIEKGLTSEAEVDKNLRQLLPTRFRLGLFDPVGSVAYDKISTDVVRQKEHIELAYEAAAKSLVLLKNKDQVLPLDPNLRNLFVTGPMAAHMQALLANYYGLSGDMKTLLEGIVDNVSDHTAIRYVQGGLMDRPNVNPMDWYSEEAEVADVTIACMGISQLMEGEEGEAIASPSAGDREYINLPPNQIEYLKLMRKKAKKLIVVVTGGSAISSPELEELADAIIYVWYPGEQGGQALGDMIFGKISPSGKLPVTFVKTMDDLPPYEDYDMTNRTYRYMKTEALYPFGFGLSYADISFGEPNSSSTKFRKNKPTTITIPVTNNSDFVAEEVVQLYVKNMTAKVISPNCELRSFQRVRLQGGETKMVEFVVDNSTLEIYDKGGKKFVKKGTYEISIGSCVPFQRSLDLGATPWKTVTLKAN
ncbi:glycoside hydrolase family 3 C-terminal domain-containing protein [Saprospiraceae bacterium]|nr:glycoside hydrolase family 3 C-terminal domain-containing protein [Saprospiraceae bacterium]